MTTTDKTGFESWAVVEVMGHVTLAGRVTEETLFNVSMVRIDVPETSRREGYTRYFGASALYSITPTTEEIVKAAAERLNTPPVQPALLPKTGIVISTDSVYDPDRDDDGYGHDYDEDDEQPDGNW